MKRKLVKLYCFIFMTLIFAPSVLQAHEEPMKSLGHHVLLSINPEFIAIDYTLIQTEAADIRDMIAMNVDGDSEIADEEASVFLRKKANELLNNINVALNGNTLNFEVIKTGCAEPQVESFCCKARFPKKVKQPYKLILTIKPPYKEHENFLYYIQTAKSIHLLDLKMSGSALPATENALHDPSVLKIKFNTEAISENLYNESILVRNVLMGENETTFAKPSLSESGFGINKLKNMMRSEKLNHRVIVLIIIMAVFFGGLHALAPGHGKTIVAAYLVGTRGRIMDAVTLGLITTFTHTFSVILLGLITLFASQYIMPRQLYPYLELTSGLLIIGVGGWLLSKRLKLKSQTAHDNGHYHVEADGAKHYHNHHENHHHHHNKISEAKNKKTHLMSLISLGFSGGIVPCPDALVLLLIAIAINKIAFGLFVLLAFSFGLAFVLILIGVLMVVARPFMERFSGGRVMKILPVFSLIIIIGIGSFMTVKSVVSII